MSRPGMTISQKTIKPPTVHHIIFSLLIFAMLLHVKIGILIKVRNVGNECRLRLVNRCNRMPGNRIEITRTRGAQRSLVLHPYILTHHARHVLWVFFRRHGHRMFDLIDAKLPAHFSYHRIDADTTPVIAAGVCTANPATNAAFA